jgi:hypothetical protein
MTEPTDKLLVRMRNLLDKAYDPAATEHEKESYEAKANELMARYGIEQAMLPSDSPRREQIVVRTFEISGQYAIDRRILMYTIGHAFGCKSMIWGSQKFGYFLKLTGFESDIERTEFLYGILGLQALSGMRKAEMPWYENSIVGFRKSWLRGFTNAVYARLRVAEEAVVAETSGAELVLRDRRTEVEEFYAEENGKLRTARAPKRRMSGYSDGHRAGNNAALDQTAVGGQRTSITA